VPATHPDALRMEAEIERHVAVLYRRQANDR
jgi:hypothetical protein